ncbi:MAG: aconitate hydratase AcnA [Chloroflexota bacterium]
MTAAQDNQRDPFGSRGRLQTAAGDFTYYRLTALAGQPNVDLARLPFTIKILAENLLRNAGRFNITAEDVLALAAWNPRQPSSRVVAFLPGRVLMQDFTGVPAVVDLAAMRSAIAALGGDPARVNPLVPVELVIDHSVQVDRFGSSGAFAYNVDREYERNAERYALLRWGQEAFDNFRVVPPGTGIVHQVNLEYLARVVQAGTREGEHLAYPDTLVGTDSHTTMVNGLGVLGWGVGGIEAEAVLLEQPLELLAPEVVGFHFTGQLGPGVTATDLVLTVTEMLRKKGVVGKFVEFSGPGLSQLGLADRATLANMAPEYGATAGLFPVDDETLAYLRLTGRDERQVDLVERYCKEQGLFRTDSTPAPVFSDGMDLDLSTVAASMAGPRRPQDRVALGDLGRSFRAAFPDKFDGASRIAAGSPITNGPITNGPITNGPITNGPIANGPIANGPITNGSVAIAAITSCTNTSNPSVMLGAGLLARRAVERGLRVGKTVKTSLAPGSRVVTDYLEKAGLLPSLEQLGFNVVGYGCTTCIGNSGPLPEEVSQAVQDQGLVVAAVLSGNRNFEGRIHSQVRAAYLASPPLVVAFALAGTVDIDLDHQPLGTGSDGQPVYLRDIWPSTEDVRQAVHDYCRPELFREEYAHVFDGDDRWRALPIPTGKLYEVDSESTYIQLPPYFDGISPDPAPLADVAGARVLAMVGDSVTTDHISPAGSIPRDSPAGSYLIEHGVQPADFNSYGSRRGNHEVMIRGTFGNVRLRNKLTPDKEGDWTLYQGQQPDGQVLRIFDAAERYRQDGTPLIVLAGREYGTGSSRDWAAKGTALLGVKVVIAETYERIHRSNLVGMGVLPLQFKPGQNAASLGLTGRERYDFRGIASGLTPGQDLEVRAVADDGKETRFSTAVRIDTPVEVKYYRNGGILPAVLRDLLREGQPAA